MTKLLNRLSVSPKVSGFKNHESV